MQRKGRNLSLAAMLGFIAGMGHLPEPKVEKVSTKLPFTDDEKNHLATLTGRDKKIYVKKLKEKYK